MRPRTVAVVQARMTSTRLPGKVLLPLAGRPVIAHVVERVGRAAGIDAVCVAVPEGDAQQALVDVLHTLSGVQVVTGPEEDVLTRTLLAADAARADIVIRVTSDCPSVDPDVVAAVVAAREAAGVAYTRTAFRTGYPLGFDTEAFTVDCLRAAASEATDPYEREHVTPFVWRRPERFPALHIEHFPDLRSWRLVVDAPDDYLLAREVYDALGPEFGLADLQALFSARPELLELNAGVVQTPYERLPAGPLSRTVTDLPKR